MRGLLLGVAAILAQFFPFPGPGLAPAGSGGGSAVVATINCRSFGATATNGGTLNVKWGAGVTCWATGSTVNGTAVNGSTFVGETTFDWDWDDASLGTVSRGNRTVDLGTSIGVVAAHIYRPSTFGETCNGGTNSLHTIGLTVRSLDTTVKSGTASLSVCVENPTTTWGTPVAYCDDANCADDVGVPAGSSHGGNGTDLATILDSCDSTPRWIVLEGGVTFSTASTGITMGANACRIESYGSGRAKLRFTSTTSSATAINANASECAGVRFSNVEFAGGGGGPRLLGAGLETGCLTAADWNVSTTAGEEFSSITVNSPSGGTEVSWEIYLAKFEYHAHDGGLACFYMKGDWVSLIGGWLPNCTVNPAAEHVVRVQQADYFVLDANYMEDQQYCRQNDTTGSCTDEGGTGAKEMVTFRQDETILTGNDVFAITRNELRGEKGGIELMRICSSGSGSAEVTKCRDGDILENILSVKATSANPNVAEASLQQLIDLQGGCVAGSELDRMRLFRNVGDWSRAGTGGGTKTFITDACGVDHAYVGNVVVATDGSGTYTVHLSTGDSSTISLAKNNVCSENAGYVCDAFPSYTEDATDNPSLSANPFASTPGTYEAFTFDDLVPANAGALDGVGDLDVFIEDIDGDARPQGTAEPGVHEIP